MKAAGGLNAVGEDKVALRGRAPDSAVSDFVRSHERGLAALDL